MKKADNFDAKQWLIENKITTQSRLNENEIPLNLRLVYQKILKSEEPDYFGDDRSNELLKKEFLKILDGYNVNQKKQFLDALESKLGKMPEVLKQIRRFM